MKSTKQTKNKTTNNKQKQAIKTPECLPPYKSYQNSSSRLPVLLRAERTRPPLTITTITFQNG